MSNNIVSKMIEQNTVILTSRIFGEKYKCDACHLRYTKVRQCLLCGGNYCYFHIEAHLNGYHALSPACSSCGTMKNVTHPCCEGIYCAECIYEHDRFHYGTDSDFDQGLENNKDPQGTPNNENYVSPETIQTAQASVAATIINDAHNAEQEKIRQIDLKAEQLRRQLESERVQQILLHHTNHYWGGRREMDHGIYNSMEDGPKYWWLIDFMKIVLETIIYGPLLLLSGWLGWFKPETPYVVDPIEVPVYDGTSFCTGSATMGKPQLKDHMYCIHGDGSPCTYWNDQCYPSVTLSTVTKALDYARPEHIPALEKLFLKIVKQMPIKMRQEKWKGIHQNASALLAMGSQNDQIKALTVYYQHGIHAYTLTMLKCVFYCVLSPILIWFYPPTFVGYMLALGIDTVYHYGYRQITKGVQDISKKIHEKAIAVLMGTAIVVTIIGLLCWLAKWFTGRKKEEKKKESYDQAHYMEASNFASLITSVGELIMHIIAMFKVEIPKEVGDAITKTLTTMKLTNNVVRSWYYWNKVSYDQATMDDIPLAFKGIFEQAVQKGDLDVMALHQWVKEMNETDPRFAIRIEFFMKYWSWLQNKEYLEQETLFNTYCDATEKEFNKTMFNVELDLPVKFDAYLSLINPFERNEDNEPTEDGAEHAENISMITNLWEKTKVCWTDRKVPRQVIYLLTGVIVLIAGAAIAYKYVKKTPKQQDESLDEGGRSLRSHRAQSNKLTQQVMLKEMNRQAAKNRARGNNNNNNNDDDDTTFQKKGPGRITSAAMHVGRFIRLYHKTPKTRSLGTKSPSELAGYEYVYLRVGDTGTRGIVWNCRADQYKQTAALQQLFAEARRKNEKIYVILPTRDSDTGVSGVYYQNGYELVLDESIQSTFDQGWELTPEILTFDESQAQVLRQRNDAFIESLDHATPETKRAWATTLQTLGFPLHIFKNVKFTPEAIADTMMQYARNHRHYKEESGKFKDEALVGGTMYNLSQLTSSIFEVVHPNGKSGHCFASEGKMWTCKHVLMTSDENKDVDLPKDRVYQFRCLDGSAPFEQKIVVEKDAKFADWVCFRFVSKSMPPSIPMSHTCKNNEAYDGMGFILCGSLTETVKLRVSIGKVFKNMEVITHIIPTTAGVSGAPILDREGRVLGLHKGTLQIMNQGIPLDLCLKTMNVTSIEPIALINESMIRECFLNMDQAYEPRSSKHVWRSRVPIEIDDIPWNPVRTFEENGELRSFTVPPLKKYKYLGMLRGVQYKQEFMFKEDPVSKFIHEEGLRFSKGAYAPIHPNLESAYRDIIKRDECLSRNVEPIAYKIACDLAEKQWGDILKMREFDHGFKKHSPYYRTLNLEEVVQWHYDEEKNRVIPVSHLLDLQKQPGFPDNLKFHSAYEVLMKCAESFRQRMEALFEEYIPDPKDRTNLVYLFQTRRKKEFRDILRVLANKGRVYYPDNIDFKVLGKMLWSEMENKIIEAPFWQKLTFYGETPFYGNWDSVMRWLLEFPYGFDADIRCWDGCLRRDDLQENANFRKKYKHPEDHIACDNYYTHIMKTPIVMPDGAVFVKIEGEEDQKSGTELTLDDNCFSNIRLIFYTFIRFAFEVLHWSEKEIRENWKDVIRFIVLGDDSRIRTRDPRFDRYQFRKYAREMGYDCDEGESFDDPMTTPFVGFRTKSIGGFYLPVLDQARIFDALDWNKDIPPADIVGKLESLFMLSAPDPMAAAQVWMFAERWVHHVLNNPEFQSLTNDAGRRETKKRWDNFMSYQQAILMYFPEDETKSIPFKLVYLGYDDGQEALQTVYNVDEYIIDFAQRKTEVVDKLCELYAAHFSDQCGFVNNEEMKFHYGNYCGPGWSDGKEQPSVANGQSEPIDAFDAACKKHDERYATATSKRDLIDADNAFVDDASRAGVVPGLAARVAREYNTRTDYKDYALPQRERRIREGGFSEKFKLEVSKKPKNDPVPNPTKEKSVDIGPTISDAGSLKEKEKPMKNITINERFGGKRNGKKNNRGKKKGRRKAGKKARRIRRNRAPKARNSFSGVPITRNFRMGSRNYRARSGRNLSKMTVSGEFIIANLSVPNPVNVGQVLVNQLIAPQAFVGSELQVYAKMYEKYKFSKVHITYKQTCPTSSTGQVVDFVDPDIRDVYSTGLPGIKAAQSIAGSQTHAVYTASTCKFIDRKKEPFYWTEDIGTDDSKIYQGRFVVQSNFDSTSAAFQAGSYYINYTCHFYDRHNQFSNISSGAVISAEWEAGVQPFTNIKIAKNTTIQVDVNSSNNMFTFKGFETNTPLLGWAFWTASNTISTGATYSWNNLQANISGNTSTGQNYYFATRQGINVATNGEFSFQCTNQPATSSPEMFYLIVVPLVGDPLNVLATVLKDKKLSDIIDTMIFNKLNAMKINQTGSDRPKQEGLPKEVPLTNSEIETFQKIEDLEMKLKRERGFSPSRQVIDLLPSRKQ